MPRGLKVAGRPFEKGNKFGKGHPQLPKHLKRAREVNQRQFIELLNKFMKMTRADLQAIAKDPNTPAIELLVLKVVTEGIKNGHVSYLTTILDRLIGKPKEHIEHSGTAINSHAVIMEAINRARIEAGDIEEPEIIDVTSTRKP